MAEHSVRASDAWLKKMRKKFPSPRYKVLENGDILLCMQCVGKDEVTGSILFEDVANLKGGENRA